ncbi:MAG: hypothetical protein Kow0059_06870 [Candidatus Sumerlaeia bacterium]
MNKLLKAGLAVFAVALLTSSASAFSPVWQQPPDVLVGGCEGGGVVFTNAFDAYQYVSDQDNATTTLGIWFAEGPWNGSEPRTNQVVDGSTSNDLSINGKGEVDYSGPDDTLLPNQSLLTPALALTTTVSGDLTLTTSDGADRAVVLIASDGFTSPAVSKVFRVRGDAAACDDVSVPQVVVVNPLKQWDLQSEFNADWAFANTPLSGTAATSGQTGDALVINAPLVGQNISFWQTTNTWIPLATTGIWRARFTVSSDAPGTQWAPVRMRIFDNIVNNPCNILVTANGATPNPNVSREYSMFYEPPADLAADFKVAFFVIDVSDGQGGTFRLEKVVLDNIEGLNDLFTQVDVIDATGGSKTFNDVVLANTANVTGSTTADALTWTATTFPGGTGQIAIGQINGLVASMPANTLYRLICTVNSTTPKTQQVTWGFRLFANQGVVILMQNVNRFLGQGANSNHLADTTNRTYTTYFSTEYVDGSELRVAMDVIHNNTARSGNVTWDRAVLESVDLSLIP